VPLGVDDLPRRRFAPNRAQKQLVMGLADGHDAFQSLLDGDPELLLLHDNVALVSSLRQRELHRATPTEHPDPGVGVEPPRSDVGSAEYLDRPVRELDHRVVIVP
jgi:hypothetical protein